MNSFGTGIEFGKISSLGKIYPLCDQLSANVGIGSVHEFNKLVLEFIGVFKFRRYTEQYP